MIHKRGRSGGPVFFLAKNPGLWHNGQERKVPPVTSLTKRAIRASFLKLLNERPLNKITVKDIVEDCGINRNSFYYHYTDIPALAEEIVKDEAARIVQEYPTVDSLEQCLEIAVEFALQNRTAVLHLYNSASHEAYEHSLMDILRLSPAFSLFGFSSDIFRIPPSSNVFKFQRRYFSFTFFSE